MYFAWKRRLVPIYSESGIAFLGGRVVLGCRIGRRIRYRTDRYRIWRGGRE